MADAAVSRTVAALWDVNWDAACGSNCRGESLGALDWMEAIGCNSLGALDWMEAIACDSAEERGGET